MPPLGEIASRVVFSTYADWADACRDFRQSFCGAVTPTEEVKKITASGFILSGCPEKPGSIPRLS
jgi:hypothetical protein